MHVLYRSQQTLHPKNVLCHAVIRKKLTQLQSNQETPPPPPPHLKKIIIINIYSLNCILQHHKSFTCQAYYFGCHYRSATRIANVFYMKTIRVFFQISSLRATRSSKYYRLAVAKHICDPLRALVMAYRFEWMLYDTHAAAGENQNKSR